MASIAIPVAGVVGGVLSLWCAVSYFTGRAFVEQAHYTVLKSHGTFEVRRYAAAVEATFRVSDAPEPMKAASKGFRPLAGYIFGNNRVSSSGSAGADALLHSEKVAMTAPVVMQPAKVAMTAPVVTAPVEGTGGSGGAGAEGGGEFEVAFVMPSKYTLATLPQPLDARVSLREVPARVEVVASHNRANFPRGAVFDALVERLREDAAREGYKLKPGAAGGPRCYAYDPPWTPWFMRRNEVGFEIEEPANLR
jgi:hypothetical protein